MYPCDGYNYFLLVTDVFSSRIWTYPLKTKSKQEVQKQFEDLFSTLDVLPTTLSTDQGKEFVSLKSFFNKLGVYFSLKYNKNKANFSEHGIFLVKSRLFRLLRHKLSEDWVRYLPSVTENLNKRILPRLGYLSPSMISSPINDVDVQKARKKNNIHVPTQPSWQEQNENQKKYEASNSPFQKNQFVYLDEPQKVFNKSFHVQVNFFTLLVLSYVNRERGRQRDR